MKTGGFVDATYIDYSKYIDKAIYILFVSLFILNFFVRLSK